MSFRKDFIWGAATASYQIEGAAFEARELEGGIEHVLERQVLSLQNLL